MKKILFGITSLTIGGAERVLVDLANALCTQYDITIFTIYDNGTLKKELDKNVKTVSLYNKQFNDFSKIQQLWISLKLLFLNKPPKGYDTYIAFLEGPITRLFSKNKTQRKIAWVHNDISRVFGRGLLAQIKKKKDKKVYKKYDKIVFVSKENQKDFNRTYGKKFDEMIIRNYLDYNKVIEKSNEEIEIPYDKKTTNFVTVCRLVEQKAIDRFISVHANLMRDGIKSNVYIVGDGPMRGALQKKIDRLGLKNNFILLGAKSNPYPYIKHADCFCLLSYYEGYGMVLDEAKILNKNIIITDTAARESVEFYTNSLVVGNDKPRIYDGLKDFIEYDSSNPTQTNAQFDAKGYYDIILLDIKKLLG